MKYYTTIEQSKKLVELGINVNTADMINMCYSYTFDGKEYTNCKYKLRLLEENEEPFMPELNIPCWSTEALLDILDETIVFGTEEDCHEYTLHFGKDGTSYYMYYEDTEFVANNIVDELDFSCSTLLNCAFEMIVKLKEMKLI